MATFMLDLDWEASGNTAPKEDLVQKSELHLLSPARMSFVFLLSPSYQSLKIILIILIRSIKMPEFDLIGWEIAWNDYNSRFLCTWAEHVSENVSYVYFQRSF